MPAARIAESYVEEHTLAWLRENGYTAFFGPDVAPANPKPNATTGTMES
jgi:hypothetical protein